MVFSTLNLAYLLSSMPLKTGPENKINIFNELCIALFSHLMTTILNIAVPESMVNNIGWMLIIVASGNIIGNLIAMGRTSVKLSYKKFMRRRIKKGFAK